MDRSYWIARRDSSARNARSAADGKTRLIHLDLAGRYMVKASAAPAADCSGSEATRYEQLETGARWLASQALAADERREHLDAATRYARLRVEAARRDTTA